MHYSMLIQGSLTNGTFEWTNPYKYRNPTITSFSILFRPYQVMLNNVNSINVVTNTNDEMATTRSVKSLPCSIPWLTLHSRYLRRLRVMDVSGSSLHTTSISPMSWIFEKSSVWKDEQSFYPLRSMDRTWLMSLKIAKWSKCIYRWPVPWIWRLPTRTAIYSPQWSLMRPRPATVDQWRNSAYQW